MGSPTRGVTTPSKINIGRKFKECIMATAKQEIARLQEELLVLTRRITFLEKFLAEKFGVQQTPMLKPNLSEQLMRGTSISSDGDSPPAGKQTFI